MRFRQHLATGVLIAGFAAAPGLALAASACEAACCPQPPCHETSSDCEASLAAASCCDAAPARVRSAVERTREAPSCHAIAPWRSAPIRDAARARPPSRQGDLLRLVSPLRLSVVLLI